MIDYKNNHPLKIALEYYCDDKINQNNFNNIMLKFEYKMNLKWITSDYKYLYEYLFSLEGLKFVSQISNEIGEV